MAAPIRFYFDFASPYAYFSIQEVEAIGREIGRAVEWRPVLMWAILKAHGIFPPMDSPAKRTYLINDMKRSAAFMRVPYVHPVKLPLSSHLAARLYYSVEGARDRALAERLFRAFFLEQEDISREDVLIRIAGDLGMDESQAVEGMKGAAARARLERAVEEAIADGVVGSPFFSVDGEGFFGADRLSQLRWRLAREGQ
ncbi:2-hydroxychromene-2-carboxylate isomerase [Arvimicrobium flavum]|uniref:2-hydroxychromene-2-carboxylate isomerase n=1 Tax=Arvimicrobium flavum TaxID=3393320 RepID=UPI00237ADDAD|nr:2-hydroxychromene-2-carboxylate isomerase [Mesorhizobium shangrilense]